MKNIDKNYEVLIGDLPDVMNETQFQDLLKQKGLTTRPYYMRAKILIMKGLLTSGRDTKSINKIKTLVGGSYATGGKFTESRIFLLENLKVTLLWKGASSDYSYEWRKIRDTVMSNTMTQHDRSLF